MTYRRLISCGLIAGMRMEEIHKARPGMVLDLFYYRQQYDSGRM